MCIQCIDELTQLVILWFLFVLHVSNNVIKRTVLEIREDVFSPPGQCRLLKMAENRGLNILFSGDL